MHDIEIEATRAELVKLEHKLREANENELPEEEFRVAVEAKREELATLMKKYANSETSDHVDRQRRRRQDQDHHRRPVGQDEDEAFVNFSSNRRRGHDQHYNQYSEEQHV